MTLAVHVYHHVHVHVCVLYHIFQPVLQVNIVLILVIGHHYPLLSLDECVTLDNGGDVD